MKRIAFICGQGLDTFIQPIIKELDKSDNYVCHKFIISGNDTAKLQKAVQWGDIIWFEWANEIAIAGTNPAICPQIMDRKVIVRLHSYEALTDMPAQINWKAVDRLIYVASHIETITDTYFPTLSISNITETIIIPNGVDMKKHKLIPAERKDAPYQNIAYVGYINHKKNPQMALQILHDLPWEYKLHIAGTYQDRRYEVYLNHMIKEMGLTDHIYFDGWVTDMNKWYKDKSILLSTSIHEGHSYAIMEAMARGIVPVIHNFYGAEEQYQSDYLFNTIDEAISIIIGSNHTNKEYLRDCIIERGWTLQNQMKQIKGVIRGLEK